MGCADDPAVVVPCISTINININATELGSFSPPFQSPAADLRGEEAGLKQSYINTSSLWNQATGPNVGTLWLIKESRKDSTA